MGKKCVLNFSLTFWLCRFCFAWLCVFMIFLFCARFGNFVFNGTEFGWCVDFVFLRRWPAEVIVITEHKKSKAGIRKWNHLDLTILATHHNIAPRVEASTAYLLAMALGMRLSFRSFRVDGYNFAS
ncbi:hypothetical protein VNO77_10547 [Canavalia gladiata]|uniref:Uncharacterized protein n=1 Tax=Canavalia gladiata TaxID=3824 RepID=A0AAN9QXW3_CANGL